MTKMIYRTGDIVTIEAIVEHNCYATDSFVHVRLEAEGDFRTFIFPNADVKLKTPSIHVGDHVSWVTAGERTVCGHVQAIHTEHAWVLFESGDFATVWIRNLTRLPEEDGQS